MAKFTITTPYQVLQATDVADTITINTFSTTVRAKGGKDIISVTSGNQHKIFGDDGADTITLNGTGDKNTVYGDDEAGNLNGGADIIKISGGGRHSIYGGKFGDEITLAGTVGNDILIHGDSGADIINIFGGLQHAVYGDAGPDTITLKSDLNMVEKNKQAKKPVLIELSLFYEENSVLIVERDSGELFDLTDSYSQVKGLSSFVLNGLMKSHDEKKYLVTTGYNRNMVRFAKNGYAG